MFDEIILYHRSSLTMKEKYVRLYDLLDRMCKELTADFGSDFSNLFSRLYALCNQTGFRRNAIEHFRINARRIQRGEQMPDAESYGYDLKALCEAVSHFYHTPIPLELVAELPAEWRSLKTEANNDKLAKRIRFVVKEWDDKYVYGFSDNLPNDEPLKASYTHEPDFVNLNELLYEGAQLNLLSVTTTENGVLIPELIVLEPDYLVDVSALADSFQSYGASPLNYLVNRFRPKEVTRHILLGNAANQFLDDCVNEQESSPATYNRSMQKAFRNELLAYSTCIGIDRGYFEETKVQFANIRQTVQAVFSSPTCQIEKSGALLEPSFICECLGLQGRMDYLQGDFRNIIELKSGKAEGMGVSLRPKESHAIQMVLYKEILYYNLDIPRDNTTTYLFYSRYPKLFAERSAKAQIQRAMGLRNGIIACERQMRIDGGRSLFNTITPDALNIRQTKGRLWTDFQRPQLEQTLAPLRKSKTIELDYFYAFASFLAREQFYAKMGDTRCDGNNGFSNTWNVDTTTKLAAGNILIDLKITRFDGDEEGIERVVLDIPSQDEGFLPNFRCGDIVLLYERNNEEDKATNKQVVRGTIESISAGKLVLLLRNRQRNSSIFHPKSRYAIEHDFMESSFTNLYKGLYALLTTDKHRRDLLLGQRLPEVDLTRTLQGNYLNEQINDIVLKAKRTKDYFLLVGPPGTGKTSVALRSMVEEYFLDSTCQILLLSYTNRAVDEICDMLESISPSPPTYVRIGSELSCEERFRKRLLPNAMADCVKRTDIIRRMNETRIFVGTVSSIASRGELFAIKHFNVAIIDEASQILEPHLVGILSQRGIDGSCAIDKFILIGDHKQLPAVVLQTEKDSIVRDASLLAIGLTDCRNSLFERLHASLPEACADNFVAMLDKQGRMHPDISEFVNRHFYSNKLGIIPLPHQQVPLKWLLSETHTPYEEVVASKRFYFLDVPNSQLEESNKTNKYEAHEVAMLVKAIYKLCEVNGLPVEPYRRIGIIVPFRNQISLIRKELETLCLPDVENITIDTVERYQGSQRDIIIFSTTISQPYQLNILSAPVLTEGEMIDRKLNVALTRAREQLFLVGNGNILKRSEIYKDLITYMESGN